MTIELSGLELWGYHGALPSERRDGQRFLFDIHAVYGETQVAASDRLVDAIDYREIVAIVREVSDGRAYFLLEALADAVARTIRERLPVARVRVRVRKPEVDLGLPVEHSAVVVELG
ncbi:MAG: dihydroneopterin aldolase [Gaiellales bacterium]